MANNWNIPDWLEKKVKSRDKYCVYCGVKLKDYLGTKGTPSDKATWEHIDNDGLPTEDNIARCCCSCNSSKGRNKLLDWFEFPNCKKKNINKETVASIIKDYIKNKAKFAQK